MSSLRESLQGPHRLLWLATSLAAALGTFLSFASCTSDVDLGGSSADAAVPEAEIFPPELVALCEPCQTSDVCPQGSACGTLLGNNEFCAMKCPTGGECGIDAACKSVPSTSAGVTIPACLPLAGCPSATTPVIDGHEVTVCGVLVGPSVAAACQACNHGDSDCQTNGCYSNWWCNTKTKHCQRPPATCP